VDVEDVAMAPVRCGDYERLTHRLKTDMTEKSFVQNRVDGFTIKKAPLGKAVQHGPFRWGELVHEESLPSQSGLPQDPQLH
jgi:hypothetical protein